MFKQVCTCPVCSKAFIHLSQYPPKDTTKPLRRCCSKVCELTFILEESKRLKAFERLTSEDIPLEKRRFGIIETEEATSHEKTIYNPYYVAEELFTSIKYSSKHRGIKMTIQASDIHEVWVQQNGLCYYSGRPMSLHFKHLNSPSLDRVDPNLGYIKENIVLCWSIYNTMKSNLDVSVFIDLCNAVKHPHPSD